MKLRPSFKWFARGTPGRRILIWCGIVVSVICTYLWVFGIATWFIVEGRDFAGNDPALWMAPAELRDLSTSSAPGRKLSYFGYEFEVPWDDLDEQKTRLVGSWQFIAFHSGKTMLFWRLPPKKSVNAMLGQGKLDGARLKRLYGDETLQSDYAFIRATLETTPGQITLFTPQRKALRIMTLLLLKSIYVSTNKSGSGIFLIQTGDFRGFQYGNPQGRPREIVDDLFADNGGLHFAFRDKSCAGGISQAEINRVIQTTRPSQHPNSGAATAPR